MNILLLLIHSIIIASTALGALKLGPTALIAFIAFQSVFANLFVVKQMTLLGLNATASDAFMIGSIFGLHLLQEYYGKEKARYAVLISFLALIFYTIVSQLHLAYSPAIHDTMQQHFQAILQFTPRITIASITVFTAVLYFDTFLYAFMKKLTRGRYLLARNTFCIMVSQLLDTVLFSFLGLYGIIDHIGEVILVSYTIKMVVMVITRPFLAFSRKVISRT